MRDHLMVCLSLVLLLSLTFSLAQIPQGQIRGIVTDQTGGVIPGADVTLESQETGVARSAVTNDQGAYFFATLDPGLYRVTVAMVGFNRAVNSDIRVRVADKVRVDIVLTVGEISETVEVVGGAPIIQTESTEMRTTLSENEVKGMPLDGREFSQLAVLMPGVRERGKTGGALITQFATQVAIGGTNQNKNSYSVDGIDNTFLVWNGPSLNPSIDAIQEFRIDRTMSPAEYGRGGTQVQLVTKRGTSEYHGSLFYYHRNYALNAGNWTTGEQDTVLRHQFGASVGGPIVRDKLFFFFNWESQREKSSVQPLGNVFTDAMRDGDLSLYSDPIVDPDTGEPFPGNIIPPERLDPVAQSYLESMMPRANLPGALSNFIRPFSTSRDWDQFIGRVDFSVTDVDDIFFRFAVQPREGLNAPLTATSIPATEDMTFYNFGAGYNRSWSPSFITESRFGYHKEDLDMSNLLPEKLPEIPILGLPPDQPPESRLPTLFAGPYHMAMWGYPWVSTQDSIEFMQNASWFKGNHLIKAGFSYRAQEVVRKEFAEFQIVQSFTGGYTGRAEGDYLLGLPFTASQNLPPRNMQYNYGDITWYVQDDWKVTPNLTFNLGLRYDYFITPRSKDLLKWANFYRPDRLIAVAGDRLITEYINPTVLDEWAPFTIPATQTSLPPETLAFADKNNFAPRIGVAWRPFCDNTTVVRAGYGIFYILQDGNISASLGNGGAPYLNSVSATNTFPASFKMGDPFAGGAAVPPPNPTFFDPDMQDTYMQHTMVSVQRELPWRMVGEISFQDQNTKKYELTYNLNQPPACLDCQGDLQSRRPYPEYAGSINSLHHDGYARYTALEAVLRKQSAHYTFQGSYTWAKNIGRFGVIDIYNRDLFRGPFDYAPHLLKFHFLMDLPFGSGREYLDQGGVIDLLLGGWTTSGSFQWAGGDPLTVTWSGDPANVGNFSSRPTRSGNPKVDNPTPERWFDTSVFSAPTPGTFGNSGTGILIGPSSWTADFALFKNFRTTESTKVQFRAEMFNVFNHPNWNNPQTLANGSNFGQILSKSLQPRVIQLALRFEF
jgi:hypothetical protein